jgi:hypothetical protein
MLYVEFLIDDERYELELHPGMVFTKCAKCNRRSSVKINEKHPSVKIIPATK